MPDPSSRTPKPVFMKTIDNRHFVVSDDVEELPVDGVLIPLTARPSDRVRQMFETNGCTIEERIFTRDS